MSRGGVRVGIGMTFTTHTEVKINSHCDREHNNGQTRACEEILSETRGVWSK